MHDSRIDVAKGHLVLGLCTGSMPETPEGSIADAWRFGSGTGKRFIKEKDGHDFSSLHRGLRVCAVAAERKSMLWGNQQPPGPLP